MALKKNLFYNNTVNLNVFKFSRSKSDTIIYTETAFFLPYKYTSCIEHENKIKCDYTIQN